MITKVNDWHRTFLKVMHNQPINQLYAQWYCFEQDGTVIPITQALPEKNNCYAVSPMTLITGYAEDELPKIQNRWVHFFCLGLIKLIDPVLTFARFDQVVTLNNQCLSTNMYSRHWQTLDTLALKNKVITNLKECPLILRSLNHAQHHKLMARLRKEGWLAITTRQVYLQNHWADFEISRDYKQDLKLLNQSDWHFKALSTEAEFERAKTLYDQLYLQKYSQHNIQFTATFMRDATREGLVQMFGLFHQKTMLAVMGIVIIDGDMTCPIIGYDTTKPQTMNLYRRLSVFTIQYARDHQLNFNMSSGAPTFKRNRRAKPCIEYSYVYIHHLPILRRTIWRLVSCLSKRVYQPILLKYRL